MSLNYYLIPNTITDSEDDYRAVCKRPNNYTLDDVYKVMTGRGSTITKAEALAAFEEITQGIIDLVSTGNSVSTPLVNISCSIAGVFNGDDDSFDPERHTIRIGVNPGLRLKKVSEEVPVEKVQSELRKPVPKHFFDMTTDTKDTSAKQLGTARITGFLLSYDEEDEDQGIWFIKTDGQADVKVGGKLARNKPGELIFNVPETDPGEYTVEVRSILHGNTQMRTGVLPATITVI